MSGQGEKNIVFIGMPGCGKTAVSRLVAGALGRPWSDSDLAIEAAEGMRVAEIFAQRGEEHFRRLETECIARLTAPGGSVIAVGGGAVLRNGGLLRQNAVVVYLRRSVESILSTLEPGVRPLLRGEESLRETYRQRQALYERLCDIAVENEGAIGETVKKVLEALP